MADSIHQLINAWAATLTQDMTLAVTSLEGVYARAYREDPTLRGLRRFLSETEATPAAAHRLAQAALTSFQDATVTYRTAISAESPGNPETLSLAAQQLRSTIESLRYAAGRRFRVALLSRSSIAAPMIGLRVLNRAGAQIKADEMLYLIGRKALIDLYNEAQIDGLRFEGASTAQVQHEDREHPLDGLQILIDDSMTGLPQYGEVSDKWFHPRSGAVIARSE